MLYSPLQLGDALLGLLTQALVYITEHVIPSVHRLLSWESDDVSLGPIIPEFGSTMKPTTKGNSPLSSSCPHPAAA